MARIITIELPDSIEISGAKDAPEKFRVVSTAKGDAEICLTALEHSNNQKLGDTWSVSKKDHAKMADCHKTIEEGTWNNRNRGISATKFDEAIKKLNIASLAGKLTREQLIELAKVITPNGEIKL